MPHSANFGCDSSREHVSCGAQGAAGLWFPSNHRAQFRRYFFKNCFKIGLLPIVLDENIVDRIFHEVSAAEGYRLAVNLENQTVTTPSGKKIFVIY